MDFTLEATTASADAPNIEPGVYDAALIALSKEEHPDWAGPDQYGKHDTGTRYRWAFQPYEGDKPVYDAGDPIIVDTLTNTKLNPKAQTKSKGIRILEAILPAADFAAFSMGLGLKDEDVLGRACQVDIRLNDNGWPVVVAVMPPRRGFVVPVTGGFAGVPAVD